MKVHCLIAYPKYDRKTQADWNAFKVTMALKGADFKHPANITINGIEHRITATNTAPILDYFGRKVVSLTCTMGDGAGLLVLPSSGCTSFGSDEKAFRYVSAIRRAKSTVPVLAPFRWKHSMGSSASGGGTRKASILAANLVLQPLPGIKEVVLVDDVLTSGGHLRAAARICEAQGLTVRGAICFARTVWDPVEKLFKEIVEEIEI